MPSFSCPICSEKLDRLPAEGQAAGQSGTEINISATPCGHIFHSYCIQKWLSGNLPSSKQCPCCRKNVPRLRCNALFPTTYDDDSILDDPTGPSNAVIPCNHGEIIATLKSKLTNAEVEHKNLKQLYDLLSVDFESVSNRLANERNKADVWLMKAKEYESYKDLAQQTQKRMQEAESQLKQYSKIHAMVLGFEDQVAEEIRDYPPTVESIKRLLEMKHIMSSEHRKESRKHEEAMKVNASLREEKIKLKMQLEKINNEYKELQHKYEISRLNGRVRAESPVSMYPGASTKTPLAFRSSKRRLQEPIPSCSMSGQSPDVDNDVDVIPLVKDKKRSTKVNTMRAIKPTSTAASSLESTSSKASSSKLRLRRTVPLSESNDQSQKKSMLPEQGPSQPNAGTSVMSNNTILISSDNEEVLFPSDYEGDDDFAVRGSVPGAPLPVSSKRAKTMLSKVGKPVGGESSKKFNFSKKK